MAGMLSGLFTPRSGDLRQENLDEEQRLRGLAQMDPFQQAGYASLAGGRMAGKGLGEAVVTAAGGDARSPARRNQDAVDAAKAQVGQLGFDPADPKSIDEFYKRVIQILQKQGLAAEALDVSREWHKQKNEDLQTQAKTDEVARKKLRDVAGDARAQERNRILEKKGALGAETIQLLNMLDTIDPLEPEGETKKAAITARLNALAAGKGIKFMNLKDRVVIVDAVTGKEIRSEDTGAAPMNEKDQARQDQKDNAQAAAYKEAVASAQATYDAVVELYNHPGLNGILGPVGSLVGTKDEQGKAGFGVNALNIAAKQQTLNAIPVYDRVAGGTFLAGLAKLKAASPTGSTGLGAVSNIEGAKVQAAGASLGRLQDYASMRRHLMEYAQMLAGSVQRLGEAAQADSITPIALQEKPLGGAGRAQPAAAPVAPPAPAAAPSAAPAAPAGAPERWERVNGKLQKVG